jgi:Phage terminase, small subunit
VLWERYHDRFQSNSAGRQDLERLCKAIDELEAIDRRLDKEGLTIAGKSGVIRAHPLLRPKETLRAYIIRMQKTLGLIKQPPKRPVGRPVNGGVGFGPGVAEIHRQKYGGYDRERSAYECWGDDNDDK